MVLPMFKVQRYSRLIPHKEFLLGRSMEELSNLDVSKCHFLKKTSIRNGRPTTMTLFGFLEKFGGLII